MGSPVNEWERRDDEGPQHLVNITEALAVGKFEVTFEEWDACIADNGCSRTPEDEGWGRAMRPVINVTWTDAKSYVAWLGEKTGHEYRLLSEAEWEYAARAGTNTPFSFGATITADQANYNANYAYGSSQVGMYRKQTLPVGSFPANAFGVHDMHGNVWEWVEDCWNDNYAGAPADGLAWKSGICNGPVLRGGSWVDFPGNLRSANRGRNYAEDWDDDFGFRVARPYRQTLR